MTPSYDELAQALEETAKVARMALNYIDALPKDTQLPAMPGFDRDWAEEVLAFA